MTINVFIVDDSATARTAMRLILEDSSDINVLGVASTPPIALKRMNKQWPDVIISDLEMPDMSGLEFLAYLQANKPTPFIVFSNYTGDSAMSSVEALSKGALDIIPKPDFSCEESLHQASQQILNSIRAAATAESAAKKAPAKARAHKANTVAGWEAKLASRLSERRLKKASGQAGVEKSAVEDDGVSIDHAQLRLMAIGSSTGGTSIIERILRGLHKNSPPVVIVQHMPEHFTLAFAKRINQFCDIEVKEAEEGDVLRPGLALIAPGGKHMALNKKGSRLQVIITQQEPVNSHKPSVDILFQSVAALQPRDTVGVILTGMGKDGAKGLLAMRQSGAMTIAQLGDDCAVNGMPKAAMAINAVDLELSAVEITASLATTQYKK